MLSKRARRVMRKLAVAIGLALVALAVALCGRIPGALANAMSAENTSFYDIYYRLRPFEDRTNAPVVIVVADEASLKAVSRANPSFGWPWPREMWGQAASYVADAGAKAIAFDITFSEKSMYDKAQGDDDAFAEQIKAIKIPVIFGSLVNPDGTFDNFAPPIPSPLQAAVNITDSKLAREYTPVVQSKDSLAIATVKAAGLVRAPTSQPFLLHYYGPSVTPAGRNTFTYISVVNVFDLAEHGKEAETRDKLSPDFFKGKIVLLATIAQGTYDEKASPLDEIYPGVETQATAIVNLIEDERVVPLSAAWMLLIPLACSLTICIGIIVPQRAIAKLVWPVLTTVLIFGVGIVLFRSPHIRWFAPAESLAVVMIATPAAFAYTFFSEDRQRRFMLKALSKVVSPAIAQELANDPQRLALGTVRSDLTVLFTDLANFTTLSENLGDQQVGELLNQYLGAMSDQVLMQDGTLDKYIGDALMCFWNAPLPQQDHAVLACRTALAMLQREAKIREELGSVGEKIHTRIGINTTSARVGFVGSSHLFNYTAIGDGVNLASRLEGANKLYGTRILISQNTADLVKSFFVLRRIDTLRVKGKHTAIAVYEVLAENGDPSPPSPVRIELYESGLEAYQKQNWDTAERFFLELCDTFGEDSASRTMLDRIAILRHSPPAVDWDGTYDAKDK